MIGRLNIIMYLRHVRRVSCREITSQNVDLNEPRPWHRLLKIAHCDAYIDANNPYENATGKTCAQAHCCWNSLKFRFPVRPHHRLGIGAQMNADY